MFSLPLMLVSLVRSTTQTDPSSSCRTRSPEWNHPPPKAVAVSSGLFQ